MEIINKNILIISPEHWNHIFVSKHQYAVHLAARGNRVFFLNPPSQENGVHSTDFKNLKFVDYTGFPAGLRLYPSVLRRSIVRKTYERVQTLCGIVFDLIWSFDNSVFFDFDALPPGITKISHIVDLNQDFQTAIAASTADCCLCTTDFIRQRLLGYNSRVYKISHGFNATFRDSVTPENGLDGTTRVLYAGNLAMPYIDWTLLNTVTAENPDVDFYFVGPEGTAGQSERRILANRSNVHFLGRVDASRLQDLYSQADALLIVYQERYHKDQANPHKMMEYLGSGKVIVATQTLEYVDLSPDLLCMAEKNGDFPRIFREAINKLPFLNSREKQMQRMTIAMDNTYEKQIERIEHLI